MSISNKQNKTLLSILFITAILSLFYYSIIIFPTNSVSWNSFSSVGYFGSSFFHGLFVAVVPFLLLIIGYGIQLTLIFLKQNKRRLIFSIISYGATILLFAELIFIYSVDKEVGIFDIPEHIGIVPWSFLHLLFLLIIVFNFSLKIFLTHIKISEENKNDHPENKKIIKAKFGIAYLTVSTIAFVFITFYLTSACQIALRFFYDSFNNHSIKNLYKILFSFVLMFQEILMIGVVLQIVSLIDSSRGRLGLTGIILQIIGIVSSFAFIPYSLSTKHKGEVIYLIFYSLTIVVFISSVVAFFVFRKQNKQSEMKTEVNP